MNFANNTAFPEPAAFVYDLGAGKESNALQRKWREEVLPHFRAPASRESFAEVVTVEQVECVETSLDDAVELESPNFVPRELSEFAQRGFARKNRWVKPR